MGTKARPRKADRAADGRQLVRSDSRPIDATTYFTSRGDTASTLGNGEIIQWDFSTADDEVTDSITTTIPSGFKRKRLKLSFSDDVRVKEGTLYWLNAPFGTFVDFWVVCPDGQYYYDRSGTPQQASGDTPIVHYVNHHMIMGDCPMGDEMNTEAANENPIPPNYELWVEVTIDENDTSCVGSGELELYRTRTHLLPGESA